MLAVARTALLSLKGKPYFALVTTEMLSSELAQNLCDYVKKESAKPQYRIIENFSITRMKP